MRSDFAPSDPLEKWERRGDVEMTEVVVIRERGGLGAAQRSERAERAFGFG